MKNDLISNNNKKRPKIKTHFARIIVGGKVNKPYYSILYYDPSDDEFHIGFGSSCLEYVFNWLSEEFEITGDVFLNEPVRHGRWELETNSGYRDSYFEDYVLVVSITAKCSECGENHGRSGHVYGDEFMGEEDGARPVENVEEKIEQTRNKYLDWLRSGRCKLMNYCPNCGARMRGDANGE